MFVSHGDREEKGHEVLAFRTCRDIAMPGQRVRFTGGRYRCSAGELTVRAEDSGQDLERQFVGCKAHLNRG